MTGYTGSELCALSATRAVTLLRAGEVSAGELVAASIARIAETDAAINALPTLCAERATTADSREQGAPLFGLPLAIKDLTPVAGVRTTFGTMAYADFIPDTSDPLVTRIEARGGIVMGKSNTPELGAGGNTFNAVFGCTRNPWNTALSAGGSSGGSAAALATGQVWLAHGSDLGGSLRTPAAYCGVVGLRPSPGVAGGGTPDLAFGRESVQGPMARCVADCALFLDAMAGFDPMSPVSWPAPETPYASTVMQDPGAVRIAFSPTMGGFAPCESGLVDALAGALSRLAPDIDVVEACPPLPGLERTYLTLRAMVWAAGPGHLPATVQSHFKPTLSGNIAQGKALDIEAVYDAQRARSRLFHHCAAFLQTHDVLATPIVGLMPRPVEEEYPATVAGEPVKDYIDWLRFSYLASTVGMPALVLPVAWLDGMPVGLQLMGRPRGEARLLQIAHRIEQILGIGATPIDPRPRPATGALATSPRSG